MKFENEEFVKAVNEIKNELMEEKTETERAIKRETDVKERNKQLVTEIEKLRGRINELGDDHKKALDKVMMESLDKQNKYLQKIEK